jgi:hypothetical protein
MRHGSLDVIGKPEGERNDRQCQAGGARGRENGTAGNVKIPDTVDVAVRIHHASSMAMRVAPCDGSHGGHNAPTD